jgi:hypothetical protein
MFACRGTALSVNKGKNFPSLQMLSACWVISSVRMRSGTREAQCRKRVKLIKNHPVYLWKIQ